MAEVINQWAWAETAIGGTCWATWSATQQPGEASAKISQFRPEPQHFANWSTTSRLVLLFVNRQHGKLRDGSFACESFSLNVEIIRIVKFLRLKTLNLCRAQQLSGSIQARAVNTSAGLYSYTDQWRMEGLVGRWRSAQMDRWLVDHWVHMKPPATAWRLLQDLNSDTARCQIRCSWLSCIYSVFLRPPFMRVCHIYAFGCFVQIRQNISVMGVNKCLVNSISAWWELINV